MIQSNGFPFEAIAVTGAAKVDEGAGPGGEDVYYFFTASPIEYTENNVSGGIIQTQLGVANNTDPYLVRNGQKLDVKVGDRVVIVLDANGLGAAVGGGGLGDICKYICENCDMFAKPDEGCDP